MGGTGKGVLSAEYSEYSVCIQGTGNGPKHLGEQGGAQQVVPAERVRLWGLRAGKASCAV